MTNGGIKIRKPQAALRAIPILIPSRVSIFEGTREQGRQGRSQKLKVKRQKLKIKTQESEVITNN
ncbi:hypothetical protein DSM107010_33290 [Chroococcidiopsis cubana SAG 39.79]|uniref:Uncharacterized protein n=1 Tax=Chroococcidiopsis cubana SAG 39.79 TaxID=388085 RepID=A0AB37UJ36_9CYAN|nr:hypothetical protein DSM107010_33290 [Chroococcidiopsis cubana SAG 39.79]